MLPRPHLHHPHHPQHCPPPQQHQFRHHPRQPKLSSSPRLSHGSLTSPLHAAPAPLASIQPPSPAPQPCRTHRVVLPIGLSSYCRTAPASRLLLLPAAALPYSLGLLQLPAPVPSATSLPEDPPLRSELIDLTADIKRCGTWQQLRRLYWRHRTRQGAVNVVSYFTRLAALLPDLPALLLPLGDGGDAEEDEAA
ncbi:hypothetical protein Agub_g9498, partial [Astrephomene gubernaculifera]